MEHVVWSARPRLRAPVLVAAFAGWNDGGDAATIAARYLAEQWSARPFASIDAEEFFDFTSVRPTTRLVDGHLRAIEWPENELRAAAVPGASSDVVVLLGTEPHLRWRTFCAQVLGVASELGVRMVVTLGGLLAEVPHDRPVRLIGTASDATVIERYGLQASRYEGPTGIVGVLHDACHRAGIPSVSLWAVLPHYAQQVSSPKAALELVRRAAALLGASVTTTALEIGAAAYEREVDALVADDDALADYVRRLGQLYDEGRLGEDDDEDEPALGEAGDASQLDAEPGDVDRFVADVERFLRDQQGE